MTTDIPTTTDTIFGADVQITAIDFDNVAVVATSDSPATINNLQVEFRIYFRRNRNGNWLSENMFVYRIDYPNQPRFEQRKATDNQLRKLYTAVREICESLPESFLLAGEVSKADRDITAAEARLDDIAEELSDAKATRASALRNFNAAVLREHNAS